MIKRAKRKTIQSPFLIVVFLILIFVFSDAVSYLPEIAQGNLLVKSLSIQKAKAAVGHGVVYLHCANLVRERRV